MANSACSAGVYINIFNLPASRDTVRLQGQWGGPSVLQMQICLFGYFFLEFVVKIASSCSCIPIQPTVLLINAIIFYFIDEETGSLGSEFFELITVTKANPASKS